MAGQVIMVGGGGGGGGGYRRQSAPRRQQDSWLANFMNDDGDKSLRAQREMAELQMMMQMAMQKQSQQFQQDMARQERAYADRIRKIEDERGAETKRMAEELTRFQLETLRARTPIETENLKTNKDLLSLNKRMAEYEEKNIHLSKARGDVTTDVGNMLELDKAKMDLVAAKAVDESNRRLAMAADEIATSPSWLDANAFIDSADSVTVWNRGKIKNALIDVYFDMDSKYKKAKSPEEKAAIAKSMRDLAAKASEKWPRNQLKGKDRQIVDVIDWMNQFKIPSELLKSDDVRQAEAKVELSVDHQGIWREARRLMDEAKTPEQYEEVPSKMRSVVDDLGKISLKPLVSGNPRPWYGEYAKQLEELDGQFKDTVVTTQQPTKPQPAQAPVPWYGMQQQMPGY